MGGKMVGIVAYGGYVPRKRLQRKSIVAANAWFNGALRSLGKGERSMCNWDEDSLTMAVEAARDCLNDERPSDLKAVFLATTSPPFADRQNSGVLATALNLDENMLTMDVTSSQRAGTTALIAALHAAPAFGGRALVAASDKRRTKAGGSHELWFGDGAAAIMLGGENAIADYVASHQVAVDFVDHYRGSGEDFDNNWEERWIRDEGYLKIVPRALKGLFGKTEVKPAEIDHFCMPCVLGGVAAGIAKRAGIPDGAVRDNLHLTMGESGTAHPLVMLVATLQEAKPGQNILVLGWGQGADAILFRTTDKLAAYAGPLGVKGFLQRRKEEANYFKFLAFNNLVQRDKGLRSELDKQTALSALYRNKDMLIGFVGGKCKVTGTVQFPKSEISVDPNARLAHTQEDYPMANIPARVQSWTADNLTYSMDPPQHFGMVVFEEGGRLMADITDVEPGEVEVNMPVRMMFRVKDYDDQRGFTRYFWKAVPDYTRKST